jgi:hypothetical protein
MEKQAESGRTRIPYPTLAALGAIVCLLASLTHEGLGHGGMSVILGIKAIKVASTYETSPQDISFVSVWGQRLIVGGGTLLNLLARRRGICGARELLHLRELIAQTLPLTPTLSPQAGRGSYCTYVN